MNKRWFIAVFLVFLSALIGFGQDKEFTASAPASVALGDQFQYVIEGSERGDVDLPAMDGFQLMAGPFSSFSSHSQWINGKMTMETVVTYTHILRALKAGEQIIPAATVRVGRKEYRTNEIQISVSGSGNAAGSGSSQGQGQDPGQGSESAESAGEDSEAVFLRVIPSRKEVYVGEQFVSGLKVYTRVNTRPASAAKDLPYEGFYKKSIDADASAQRQDINGYQYVSQVIQRHILIPQKSGDITISPFESEWMVQQKVQRRSNSVFDSFFDDPFFNGVQEVPTTLRTRAVHIKVKALPSGAPKGFTGGVGSFSMKASLSAEEVEVNEAISLKITIGGTGNLPLLGEPVVNLPPDHDAYDVTRSVNTSTDGNRISGSVSFEYPIVARHAGRFRIAPIQFAWFDPVSKAYKTATSQEFSFTVVKGEGNGTESSVYVPGINQESVKDLGTDIRDINRLAPPFTPMASTLMSRGWYKMVYLLAALALLLTVILIRILAKRNADLSLVRNRKANRTAQQRLKKADRYRKNGEQDAFYDEVGKAIWGYFGDKLSMSTSNLSRDMVSEALKERGVDEELLAEFVRILDESEFSRFAPSSQKSDMDLLYRDAAKLIRNIESCL